VRSGARWVDRALVVSPYCVGLCTREAQFKNELRRLKVPLNNWPDWIRPGANATVHYLENAKNHSQCCIVCLEKTDRAPSEVIGLLIHEAVHIWQFSCEDMNETEPSEEFEAYSIQTIAQRLIEAYGLNFKT
jgi:hypothetical protein